jgi:hypothetical protein
MQYRTFGKDKRKVSILGFGCMRLPTDTGAQTGIVDEKEAARIIHYGIDNGINYVDTAKVYHNGKCEAILGRILQNGYREKVSIATKLPIWEINSVKDADRIFDEQRLAHEPELRQRLTLLEETWHYLALLDRESVDAEQIEKTLKVTAISLSGVPLIPPRISMIAKWATAVLAGMALFVITFYFGKHSEEDDPYFRRMIERLEMYNAVSDDGLEFLQMLTEKRVFLPEGTLPIKPIHYRDEFDAAEWYQLFSKNILTYRLLSRDSKKKAKTIRKLHRDIEGSPQSAELVLTLQNYYHWLKSLQQYERKDLKNSKTKVADIIALKDRLDKILTESPLMSYGIIGIEKSKHLAETLAELTDEQQERILNNEPHQIINELNAAVQ